MISRFANRARVRSPAQRIHLAGSTGSSRGGFVLVMVLILLTVAAISLSGLARRSMRIAAESADAQADFERKWQTATLQRALLSDVDLVLRTAEVLPDDDGSGWPNPAVAEGVATVGEYRYEFLLADEDAKINLNTVLRRVPNAFAEVVRGMNQSTVDGGVMPLPTSLLPRSDRGQLALESWGQVFVARRSGSQGTTGRQIKEATRQLTCWGSGRLNVKRASDRAIRTLCGLSMSGNVIDKLLQERAEGESESLDALISRLELRAEERFVFQRLLTDRSNCFTLWLTISNRQREWMRLAVSRSARGKLSSLQSFTW